MKFFKSFLIVAFVFSINMSFSQDRGIPVYSDYLTDNYYLIHPSMAGASNSNKLRLTGRQQWFDVDDAPSLQTLSMNGKLGDNIGVGGILFNDTNGRFSQQGAYLTFAYHLMFSRNTVDLNQLSFGLNVGLVQEKLDETDLNSIDNPDPVIAGVTQSDSFFNVDFGMSYFYLDFFAHLTVKNLIPQQRQIFSEVFETDNQRQYLTSVGYNIAPFGSSWSFEPSVMLQLREETRESNVDLNAKAYYTTDFGRLWGGVSYRRTFDGAEYTSDGLGSVESQKLQYVSPFIGLNYNRFMVAYTYSYQANSIVMSNSGFHQITLGFNFGKDRKRYKCNCPAVNF